MGWCSMIPALSAWELSALDGDGGVQYLAHFSCQGVRAEGLSNKRGALLQYPVMNDGVVRVAGHVEDFHSRTQRRQPFG